MGSGITGLRIAGLLLGWSGGLAWQLQQAEAWPGRVCLLLVATGLSGLAVGLRWRRLLVVALAGSVLCGAGWAGGRALWRLGEALPPALEGQDLQLTGVVAGLPQAGPSGTRFVFEVESAWHDGVAVPVPGRLALGWYRQWHDESTLAGPRDELRAGQRWRFTVRLKRPHGSLNPGGFDYELWLFEQGVRATGYVRSTAGHNARRLDDAAGHPVERLRQHVHDAIFAAVDDPRAAGVLAALAVGDQAAIERTDWNLFRAAGIAHLVSISGLHITMFALLAGGLVGRAWRRSTGLMLRWPAPWAARWGGVAAAAGYSLLAGWGVPAQRTVWMLATAAALSSLGLRWPWPLVLLSAGAVVGLLDPWALLQPGFWLSFTAVGLLMASSPVRSHDAEPEPASGWRRWAQHGHRLLRDNLRSQLIATIGLAPLTLVFFQQLSLVGFAANLLAIPLITLVITPLALLGMLLTPLWWLGAAVVQWLVQALAWLTAWPGAVWTVPLSPAWAQAAALLAAALAVMPLPWRLRLLAVPLALPLLWPAMAQPAPGRFELLAADIGQGSAVLVRTRGHLLLFDTGPQYGPDSDAGERVLLPLLRARGEGAIDLLMLSHRDLDHVGGAAAVLAGWPVRGLSSSLAAGHPLRATGVPHRACEAGQSWAWDGVRFEVLHPAAEELAAGTAAGSKVKPNALSCVLRVTDTAGHGALLTGDIEAPQEAALVAAFGDGLRSEVLMAPHHGSKTSSSAAFLDAVAPSDAIVQAGYRNRFGHPAPPVLARYAERGITVVRSDRCGAWTWRPGDGATCERHIAHRYWHFPDRDE